MKILFILFKRIILFILVGWYGIGRGGWIYFC